MKIVRLFLLLGVSAMLLALAWDYHESSQSNGERRVEIPEELPIDLNSKSGRWQWSQSSGESNRIEVSADSFREVRDSTVFELSGVELKIHHLHDSKYDEITTEKALFQASTGVLSSDETVVMRLGLSSGAGGDSGGKPTVIRTSGVTFDSKAGISSTERHTEYEFDGGSGESKGSYYDSQSRMFKMLAEARLVGAPNAPGSPAPRLEANELVYFEKEQRIDLHGDVMLQRGAQHVNAEEAHVYLENGALARIEAISAAGSDQRADRHADFRADRIEVFYRQGSTVERIAGTGNARLVSVGKASSTSAVADWIDLRYVMLSGAQDSILDEADARGRAELEWTAGGFGVQDRGSRRLTSEWIHLKMRSGGGDVENLETLAPGKLELASGGNDQEGRVLTAQKIEAAYAPGNKIKQLHASGEVHVRTLPPPSESGTGRFAPLQTWSGRLLAAFDPASGDVRWLKQWDGFRFTERDRSGSGQEAMYRPSGQQVEIIGDALVEEPAGRINAARIYLDQAREMMTAEGDVTTSFVESPQPADKSGDPVFFSAAKPVFASGGRLVRTQQTGHISYSDGARMWQGDNRIAADRIDIYRGDHLLEAEGNVVTHLKPAGKSKRAAQPLRVSADSLSYDNRANRAYYRGKAELRRDVLTVTADSIEGILRPDGGENGLDWALATGDVSIREAKAEGGRRGYGNEAQFWPNEDRIVLRGEPARLIGTAGDETRGRALTYSVGGDRLLVRGNTEERALSVRRP